MHQPYKFKQLSRLTKNLFDRFLCPVLGFEQRKIKQLFPGLKSFIGNHNVLQICSVAQLEEKAQSF